MLEIALKVLNIIEEKGYKAYIVGGFSRDLYLGITSNDVDICTNATPKEIKEIFPTSTLSNSKYGSITFFYKKIRFETTTFREEGNYQMYRKPQRITYIDDLKQDLLRRDFTINTLCIDAQGDFLDFLNVRQDLDDRVIKVVGDPKKKISEDALRILRAIRFASTLNFTLDPALKKQIKKHAHLVKNLSYYRKKEELDKIFTSVNIKEGINLLKECNLLKPLEITNADRIVLSTSLIGIWAQLDVVDYNFTKHEKMMIDNIRQLLKLDILDDSNLYKYGLYESEIAGEIKGVKRAEIVKRYNALYIHGKRDIAIKASDINKLFNRELKGELGDIYNDLERALINREVKNTTRALKKYIIDKYKTTK